MTGVSVGQCLSRVFLGALVVTVLLTMPLRMAAAQIGSDRYASIVVDGASGDVLSSVNADEYRFPASLTKMMTIYMLFEALRDRRLAMSQPVPVSSWAAAMPATKLGLLPGTYITVEQALLGLVTKSANDAAAALGEMMGGDEERFAQMMTLRARALGMTHTTFRNASGLPDWSQMTTARDMAMLGRRLIYDFPSYYHYFSAPSFVFQGRTILNHQRLLQSYPGADGLKTGYIGASGFNVVTSAVRADTRLVGVVLGGASGWERDQHMASLLDLGFDRMGVPVLTARYEPPAAYRIGGLIGLAQAASLSTGLAAPRFYDAAPSRGGRRGAFMRSAQGRSAREIRATPADIRTASLRPVPAKGQLARVDTRAHAVRDTRPDTRSERLRARPLAAVAVPAASRRAAAPAREPAPTRVVRSKGTRTADGANGRIPG